MVRDIEQAAYSIDLPTRSETCLFTPGAAGLQATPLVDLGAHDYRLEPNVTFTPDGRSLVFRSNMHGASHVYMVSLNAPKVP